VTGRTRVLAATILGSSLAFIDASVVNVALPAVQASLQAGTAAMRWVVDAYLLPLGALVLLGGALGDRLGRVRVFMAGVVLATGAADAVAGFRHVAYAGAACAAAAASVAAATIGRQAAA